MSDLSVSCSFASVCHTFTLPPILIQRNWECAVRNLLKRFRLLWFHVSLPRISQWHFIFLCMLFFCLCGCCTRALRIVVVIRNSALYHRASSVLMHYFFILVCATTVSSPFLPHVSAVGGSLEYCVSLICCCHCLWLNITVGKHDPQFLLQVFAGCLQLLEILTISRNLKLLLEIPEISWNLVAACGKFY